MPSGSFTGDSEIVARHFYGDAWIIADRWRHHRIRDHEGAESDLYVVLAANVGPYVAGTPIHYVLEDMVARLLALESATRQRGSFTGDAWISDDAFTGDAMIHRPDITGSFTGDAEIVRGGAFTGDAWIQAAFTGDAFIIAA